MTTPTSETRFQFGDNWLRFLNVLTDAHIAEAERSMREFLGTDDLSGRRFLDIGSGSGLHSLAARRFGATVHAFDYDPQSVACTQELKRRYFPGDPAWTVEQNSVLDAGYMQSLGVFDIVYSWGVLHHTGFLWQALYNAQLPLQKDGLLFIAIYNDQGLVSKIWEIIKRTHSSGKLGRAVTTAVFFPVFFVAGLLIDLVKLQNPARRYREHKKYRGMSLLHDWRDWLGGYPFEVAAPERIIAFYKNLGFELVNFQKTGHGFGNNQYLFRKL